MDSQYDGAVDKKQQHYGAVRSEHRPKSVDYSAMGQLSNGGMVEWPCRIEKSCRKTMASPRKFEVLVPKHSPIALDMRYTTLLNEYWTTTNLLDTKVRNRDVVAKKTKFGVG